MKAFSSARLFLQGICIYPVLPLKINGKLFPLCRTCAETYSQQKCLHTEEERSFTGTWVSGELKTAIEKGYVMQTYEVWHFGKKNF